MRHIKDEAEDRSEEILQQPATLLWEYMVDHRHQAVGKVAFDLGRLAFGLEIETRLRIFRALSDNTLMTMNKEEVLVVLEDLLNASGIRDDIDSMYDKLIGFRKVRMAEANVNRTQPTRA